MEIISDEIIEELSKFTTNSFSEMFFAIIESPSYFEILYRKTIYGPKTRLVMLASNIVKKSPDNFKPKAKQIFSKIYSIIFKKYHNESLEKTVEGKII